MKLNFSYTRLFVNDYNKCLQFYRDILGLETKFISEVDRYAKLTILCRSKLKEYFGNRTPVFFGQKNDAIALSFHVENIDKNTT